jgi:hypothetical protein
LKVIDDPEQAPNVYARYVSAAQKQFMQGKQKAQDAVADKKVNMAVTKQDSIFPNIHLSGGISSKATEYKELAMKGDKWESPVFKLGSASTSSNIPATPEVTRKKHSVNQGGVRGPQNVGTNGSANMNTAGGFRNEVDQAFGKEGTQGAALNGNTNGSTTLGADNPVLTGRT